jgi:uncharacterized membrane protein
MSIANFTLEKDDTSPVPVTPYGVTINRDFDDNDTLEIYIRDTDNGSSVVGSGVEGAFWTMTNASEPPAQSGSYILAYINYTDSSGYLRYNFNPNCSYGVGDLYWRSGAYYNDTCYKGASSAVDPPYTTSARLMIIKGHLKTNLTEPNQTEASNIQVGDNVTFRFGVPTDCSGIGINDSYQTGLSLVLLELQDPEGGWENCTQGGSINDEGNGWYNCTWETKWHKGGNYTVRITVEKPPNYNDNVTILTNYTYLNNTPPDYGNFSVDPLEDGWGAIFNYSFDIWDLQEDNVTCKLYVKTNNYGGQWILKNSTIVYEGRDKCSLTVSDLDCGDIGDDSVNAYMFELNDETNIFNTTNQSGPNITADSVDISYYYGNFSEVNRSDNEPDNKTLLMVFVNDTDNGQPADANVTFWVTTNSSDPSSWDSGNLTETNSSGVANVSFNPGCAPQYSVGNQLWKAGVTDGCYVEVNTTEIFNLTIYGTLSTTIYTTPPSEPVGNETPRGSNVTQQVYVESDCAGNFINDANVTIDFINEDNVTVYNCTPVYRIPADGFYECKRNTTDMLARWYDTKAGSNRTSYNSNTTTLENHFFIKTKPILFNETIIKDPAGWGENRSFNVTVNDDDLDNVTVYLYIKCLETAIGSCPGIYQDWHLDDNVTLGAPLNETITLNLGDDFYGVGCPTIGNWSYRFNATDIPHNYKDSTTPHNFTVEKNDVVYENISGWDNPTVWRNGSDSTLLSVKVWDNDSKEYIGSGNATVWVTKNASDPDSWDPGKYIGVNGSGYINYDFLADGVPPIHECNYTVGVHNWTAGMGGIDEDSCYKTSNSSIYQVQVWSGLRPDVISPTGTQGFLQGNLINVSGYVEDDCSWRMPYGVEGVTIDPSSGTQRYRLEGPGSTIRYCTANWNEGEGWYNCSWDSSGQRIGNWSIVMSVERGYYAPNSTTEAKAFNLGFNPYLSNPWVSPTIEGWGYRFQFHVYFGDADFNPNNISLWKSFDNQTWDYVDSTVLSSSGIDIYLNERFQCDDSLPTPGRVNYYKFNTTDTYGYTDETGPETFNITEDSVTLTLNYSESSDNVRRIGDDQALLKFRVRDDDYSYQNPNGSFYPSGVDGLVWATSNGTNYTNVLSCQSSDGHCEVNYNPNCSTSLVGVQQWKGGTNDTCYEYENSTNETLEVIGQLNVSIVNPVENVILNRNTTAVFNATVKDDCDLLINDSNVTWYNESWGTLTSGYNTTWFVPYDYPLGQDIIRANTSRTYYDGNTNSTNVYIYGWAELNELYPPNGTVYLAGTTKTIKCHVRDANTLVNFSNYTVAFYINETYQESKNTSNQSGEEGNVSFLFSTNRPAGWYNLTCKINGSSYWYYNVSGPNITNEVRVSRPLLIDQIVRDPSDGNIYRNDSYSPPYQVNITVHVKDADLPGAGADNATVWFYNHSHAYIGNCTTNASGWCNESVSWNPADTITPDYYTIYINATKPSTNENSATNTTVIDVRGVYVANITSPENGSQYGKGDLIPFNASIRDENWNWFMGSMWVYWYNDTGDYLISTVSGEQGSFDSSTQAPGYRNFTAKSEPGLPHYYVQNDTVTVQITGWADAVWVSPPHLSSVTYPYEFQRVCRVVDYVSGMGVEDYPVNFSYLNETSGQWVYNGTYITNSSGHANTSWTPWDKGNVTFNCTIWDNSTLEYTANIDNVNATIWVKDNILPTVENVSILPNQSIEAWLNTTNITADATDDYGIETNGVWAYIGLPNGSYENKTMSFVENNTYRYEYLPRLNGTYNVTIYAMDEGPENNVNYSGVYYFEVWGKATGRVNQLDYVYAGGITQTNDFKFNLTINFTNLGPPNAYYVNLTVYDDSPGYVDYNESSYYCGNLTNGSFCQWALEVTILPATPPTSINVFGNASWMDPDRTDASVVNSTYVVVASNPIVEIIETGINKTVPHDQQTYVDNITIYSSGNDRVRNILLSNAGGNFDYDCYDCTITMVPDSQGDLFAGYNFTSDIWVTIPKGKPPGVYWTYIVANSTNAGSDIYLMNLTVYLNSSWDRTPASFPATIAQPNTNGLIGQVNVTNDGNVKIYFETSKRGDIPALVIVTPEGFAVDTLSKRTINISYSVPPAYPQDLYCGVIAIRNDTLPADPDERNVSLCLNVTDLPPNITDYNVIPTEFEVGFETVYINATIVDNFAVSEGWIDVERPGDINYISESKQIASANNTGFNYTEDVNYSGIMQYFNITIENQEQSFFYVNITVNDLLIASNQSVENSTNFTIDAVQAGAGFSLPGNQTINVTIQNASGSLINASYTSWLAYDVRVGETYKKIMDRDGSFFNTTYWTNISGIHEMRICANDTSSKVGCTEIIYLTAAGNTNIAISPNVTAANVTDMTIYHEEDIHIEFNLSNVGYARAFNVTLNITYPENWSASPANFSFGTLYKNNFSSNITVISVPAFTMPGEYFVNFTTDWINLNSSYNGTNMTSILVNVTENPELDLQDRIPATDEVVITAGNTKNVTFNLTSIGNVNVTNITFSCQSGEVCVNFTGPSPFSPSNMSLLTINQTELVNITISIPSEYPPGIYNGTINASGDYTSDSSYIYINVPANISWSQEPNNITREVIQGTQGHFGTITVRNNGNVFVRLTVVQYIWNLGTYVIFSPNQFDLDVGETEYIDLNYTAPVTYSFVSYDGILWTYNESADPDHYETLLNLTVHPYFVDIISPTEAIPKLNVSPGDEIEAKINITYGTLSVYENMTFNLSLSNSTTVVYVSMTNMSYNSSEGLWYVNFTAPSLALQKGYDLNVTAIYSKTPAKKITYYDLEPKAVVYRDDVPPSILISVPARVPANTTAVIYANVTDPGGAENASIVVYDPNGTAEYGNMTYLYRDVDTYVFRYDYTDTDQIGIYSVNVTGCDKSGNCDSTNTSFEIYIGVWFSGYAKDILRTGKPVINQSFLFYDDIFGGNLLIDLTSDPGTGYYNESIDARMYDLEVDFWNDSIALLTVPLLQDIHNPVQFGSVTNLNRISIGGAGVYRGMIVNNSLSYSLGLFTLNYSGLEDSIVLSNLTIYHCPSFGLITPTPSICTSSWTRMNAVLNITTTSLAVNTTNLHGVFAIANFICGDNNCSEEYGESIANCPLDCEIPAPPPPVEPGAPGVGRGVGVEVPPGVPQVPVEIKSTLIFVTLRPGEHEIHSIDVTNNLGGRITVETSVTGNAWELVQIEKPVMEVPGRSTSVLKVKLYALPTTQAGIYTGDIVANVRGQNITHVTPVTIKVEVPPEPLLDVKVSVLTKTVEPGGNLKFELTLLNMGPTATIEDIVVNYEVKGLETERVITKSSETLAVENVKSFTKTIPIPQDTPQDRYVVEVNVTYWYGKKSAFAVDSFDVFILPAPLALLRAVFMHWLTYVVVFMLIPGFYFGRRLHRMWMEKKRVRRRYIFPIDFKKLPKVGADSILVGKIAETDAKAYVDTKALMMHSLAAGATGAGKSVSAMVCAEELLKRNVPIIVFDPTAQWTGFMKPCKDKRMFDLYPNFGMKPEDARGFKVNVILVTDPEMDIDIQKYRKPGEMTVFVMNRLEPEHLDKFVRKTVSSVFRAALPEERDLKLLLVYDEVHRLLPKYGGKGGYIAIERACREFRKWGIGVFMISQVLMDFRGAIRANIATEIQLRTKYEGDIGRVKTKYGMDYASKVVKLTTGTALVQNPAFNEGKPYFISFRPLLHDTGRLSDEEINKYVKVNEEIEKIDKEVAAMRARKVDTTDIEIELNLAKDKMKAGQFTMAESYIESLKARLKA